MRPIIEFCSSNMHHGTDQVMKKLEQNPDVDVVEYGCLGNCGECYMFPYAMVNGENILADTADELDAKIMDKLKELEALARLLDDQQS